MRIGWLERRKARERELAERRGLYLRWLDYVTRGAVENGLSVPEAIQLLGRARDGMRARGEVLTATEIGDGSTEQTQAIGVGRGTAGAHSRRLSSSAR